MKQDEQGGTPEPQVAKVKTHSRISPVWAIPVIAAGLVIYLGFSSLQDRGPEVTLTMATADGLTVDQTQLKHKAVPLGTVDKITLAPDMKSVVVKIRMVGGSTNLLTDKARFWVVRPRLSAGSLTGIETIVSGSYIEVDPGEPGGKKQTAFKALEQPPGRQSDEPGQVYVMKAQRLGSLSSGSPVFFRDVEVGQVLSADLGEGMGPVTMRIFVRAPYDKFVHPETRFWNASGISISMGPQGMHLELQSIAAILSGGITFETPRIHENEPAAAENTTFALYDDKETADAAFYQLNLHYASYFTSSVQGLSEGSPVQLFGVQVGSVTEVRLVYDADKQRMIARVAFDLQPERILKRDDRRLGVVPEQLTAALSVKGMHAQLESSSFLTGTKNLNIVYGSEHARGPELGKEGDAVVLPGDSGGSIDAITASMSSIAAKIDRIPFDDIAQNANDTVKNLQHLTSQIDTNATPALAQLPLIADQMAQASKAANGMLGAGGYGQNSEFQRNMDRTMREVNDAMRSFRVLADYLDRHPEALIRGRASQAGER